MKDYRLSEIKEICKEMHDRHGEKACELCDIERFCVAEFENCPSHWDDLEPSDDMIYLPYKVYHRFSHDWEVVYFDNARYEVNIKCFTAEDEADEFIAKLKEKQSNE